MTKYVPKSPDLSSGTIAGQLSKAAAKPVYFPEDEKRALELLEGFEEQLTGNLEHDRDWVLENCGSHERMDALMHLHGMMDFPDWLVLLGELWCNCDNIGAYKDDLVEILKEWLDDPLVTIPELMCPDERAAFDAIPDEVRIYRGCGPRNMNGLSWSLSRRVAIEFPFKRRYRADQPILLTARVRKDRIAALKLERNEQEVIVIDLPANCWKVEPITEPPPETVHLT